MIDFKTRWLFSAQLINCQWVLKRKKKKKKKNGLAN